MNEKELARAACQGDEEAFYRIVSLHKRRLYGIAYSYLHNEEDALEALQETVCRAWVKCSMLRDSDAFVPWLIRILIHCCMDELKRRKRQLPLGAEHEGSAMMISDHKVDLDRAMERLKPKYRHPVILKYYQDMTVPQIAEVLGRPEGTVKTWLRQGLKLLNRYMNYGGEHRYE